MTHTNGGRVIASSKADSGTRQTEPRQRKKTGPEISSMSGGAITLAPLPPNFARFDRRGFLKSLLGGAIGSCIDVEKMLWVPGAKKIFMPEGVRVATAEEIISIWPSYYIKHLSFFSKDPRTRALLTGITGDCIWI